jgi:alanine dehydrogenase
VIVGVPTEIKSQENRVGMVPGGVRQMVDSGHEVRVQRGAGEGSGIPDGRYERMGATMVDTAEEAWAAGMVVKVKEPLAAEYDRFHEGQILYTYLHLAAVPELAVALCEKGVSSVAYETIETAAKRLPLLKPMSEIAGKMATQVGAYTLQKENGGMGILLGGVPGTKPAHVVVIGGGNVGTNAAKIAVGMGARVTILDRSLERLTYLDDVFFGRAMTLYSNPETLEHTVRQADLLIGAVLVAGARAPKLVSESLVREMKKGAVVVDVAVDQGGCIETCRATTHDAPTYKVGDVVHYCVANMPGAVARTSTFALTNATTEYGLTLANRGIAAAISDDPALRLGLNTYRGACTHPAVAESLGMTFVDPSTLL